ncbi:Cof-type HAD-IIB family hydrolase [Bacillus sp. FJAT-45037]|uniref:Cof-type HAD-IIB family hydrolase n=1 Tax=Bacillus sp. FJAT-45037 TaxID=2011007 RepID=UPI0012FE362A|nr:Cof-type HAD-IIB family hydrolase [Bacillus sp. FJAT-45037]
MKLIAIDLDGTLLNNEGRVSAYTQDVLNEVADHGHKIAVVTGRHFQITDKIASLFPRSEFMVCFNGAGVAEPKTRELKQLHTYDITDVAHVIETLKEWGLAYVVETEDRFIVESIYDDIMSVFRAHNVTFDEMKNIREVEKAIVKLSIRGTERELDRLTPLIAQLVPELYVIRSGEQSVDVINRAASKGKAVQWLGEHYGIPREQTIAFGNFDNDMTMLEFASIGVAMANAPIRVKKIADVITASNEEDGVASFLDEYILKNKPTARLQLFSKKANL